MWKANLESFSFNLSKAYSFRSPVEKQFTYPILPWLLWPFSPYWALSPLASNEECYSSGLELFTLPGKFFPGYSLSYFLISSMSLFKCSLLSEAYLNQQVGHILPPHPPSPSTLYLPFLLFARVLPPPTSIPTCQTSVHIICLPLP